MGRALGDPGLKKSIRVGEAALREAAAFLLDHQSFARVPRTALVKASHPVFNINAPHIPSSPHSPHAIVGTPTKLASFQACSFKSTLVQYRSPMFSGERSTGDVPYVTAV